MTLLQLYNVSVVGSARRIMAPLCAIHNREVAFTECGIKFKGYSCRMETCGRDPDIM